MPIENSQLKFDPKTHI